MSKQVEKPIETDSVREVDDSLRDVRRDFINRLCDYVLSLEALTQETRDSEDYTHGLRNVEIVSHKIAGVAATLGFPALGEDARKIEASISKENSELHPNKLWQQVEPALEHFMDSMERAIDEHEMS